MMKFTDNVLLRKNVKPGFPFEKLEEGGVKINGAPLTNTESNTMEII